MARHYFSSSEKKEEYHAPFISVVIESLERGRLSDKIVISDFSTIHVNAFAGIAEIVDNSVDSEARKVKIDYCEFFE